MHEYLSDHACHVKRYALTPERDRRTVLINHSAGPVALYRRKGEALSFSSTGPLRRSGFGGVKKPPRLHGYVMPGRRSPTFSARSLLFVTSRCEVLFRQEVKDGLKVLIVEDAAIDERIQGATFSDAGPDDVATPEETGEE